MFAHMCKGQKGASGPQEPELEVAVSYLMWYWEPSLGPVEDNGHS